MSEPAVRIERFGRRGLFWTGAAFLALWLLSFAVVKTAPELFLKRGCGDSEFACLAARQSGGVAYLSTVCDAEGACQAWWTGELVDMVAEMQSFALTAEVVPASAAGSSYSLPLDVRVTVTALATDGNSGPSSSATHSYTVDCADSGCDPFLLVAEHQVLYPAYIVDMLVTVSADSLAAAGLDEAAELPVLFEMISFDPEYTAFEIALKYVFVGITFVVAFAPVHGFFWRLMRQRRLGGVWSFEQRWAAGLLLGLLLFDDPTVALAIYDDPHFIWAVVYALSLSTFVAALLLFWLCVFDDLRGSGSPPARGRGYWLPKLFVVGALWIAIVSFYVYSRLQALSDPSVLGSDETADTREKYFYAVLALAATYALWLLSLVARAGAAYRQLLPPFRFLLRLSLFVVLQALGSIIGGSFLDMETVAAFNFLEAYWCLNLYVWTLAFAYTPEGEAVELQYGQVEMQGLTEDEDDFI